ncbi:MAG: GxxExxY protein [Candidatus Marinimicrobia bacterium]|jgi:GxxExxY protein|nr:GxxExxY protein [Candidatus Neomarinimicrobiota bacterium]MBT3577066.1 GxxExxY protein [Candidatus Neomarinimicrobiota bacterium]MBT3679948.1 GxxExxY protein [Candidatus Neomarinimicrobiota bacterium]MBT3949657.1 GxxExxY protein [Candidatus Neomarinimicrobiota bacterium]MBT4253192.1 GxxExxY protein [Candidatus Neomarinimicrobiota bacterium]
MTEIIYKELSFQIAGLAMEVHKQLGYGFLEKVNENALRILLCKNGIRVKTQHPITVRFEGEIVGQYYADMLVDDKIILELKVAERISAAHKAQALNYLKGTGLKLAIILNFGPKKLESHRVVN